jgi:uracil-DNA glycosylase family 4
VENVTDETRNPFGMRPPCPVRCPGSEDRSAVLGYGDANADFHVIGDHPGVHGGGKTGIPFTGSEAGERVLDVLETVGLLHWESSEPMLHQTYLSYYHCCCVPRGSDPTNEAYRDFERFFDAELRAIAADVLLPVGETATRQVLQEYTAQAQRLDVGMTDLHGRQVRGRGFLVMPINDPLEWQPSDEGRIVEAIEKLRSMDYQQMVDLGRFIPGSDPYFTR